MQETTAPEKDVFLVRDDNIEDFKTNMAFMNSEVSADYSDPSVPIANFTSWIPWVLGPDATPDHQLYFFEEAFPKFVRSVMKRKFSSNEQQQRQALDLLKYCLEVAFNHINVAPRTLFELMCDMMDPDKHFFIQYGYLLPNSSSETAAEGQLAGNEDAWMEELEEGSVVDVCVNLALKKWDIGFVKKITDTRTEIEVEFTDGTVKWFSVDDTEYIAKFGSKTSMGEEEGGGGGGETSTGEGEGTEESLPSPPEGEEGGDSQESEEASSRYTPLLPPSPPSSDDPGAHAAWVDGLEVGDTVDVKDRVGTWYQGMVLQKRLLKKSKYSSKSSSSSTKEMKERDIPSPPPMQGPLPREAVTTEGPSSVDVTQEPETADSKEAEKKGEEEEEDEDEGTPQLRIGYIGWTNRYDEWISLVPVENLTAASTNMMKGYERIQPVNSKTFGKRGDGPQRPEHLYYFLKMIREQDKQEREEENDDQNNEGDNQEEEEVHKHPSPFVRSRFWVSRYFTELIDHVACQQLHTTLLRYVMTFRFVQTVEEEGEESNVIVTERMPSSEELDMAARLFEVIGKASHVYSFSYLTQLTHHMTSVAPKLFLNYPLPVVRNMGKGMLDKVTAAVEAVGRRLGWTSFEVQPFDRKQEDEQETGAFVSIGHFWERLILAFSSQFLKTHFLNRRHDGIAFLSELTSRCTNRDFWQASLESPSETIPDQKIISFEQMSPMTGLSISYLLLSSSTPNLSSSMLADWILSQDFIMGIFVGDNAHSSLIPKVQPTLIFLAKQSKLSQEVVNVLWHGGVISKAGGETEKTEYLKTLTSIIPHFSTEDLNTMVERIEKVPIREFTSSLVSTLLACASTCRKRLFAETETKEDDAAVTSDSNNNNNTAGDMNEANDLNASYVRLESTEEDEEGREDMESLYTRCLRLIWQVSSDLPSKTEEGKEEKQEEQPCSFEVSKDMIASIPKTFLLVKEEHAMAHWRSLDRLVFMCIDSLKERKDIYPSLQILTNIAIQLPKVSSYTLLEEEKMEADLTVPFIRSENEVLTREDAMLFLHTKLRQEDPQRFPLGMMSLLKELLFFLKDESMIWVDEQQNELESKEEKEEREENGLTFWMGQSSTWSELGDVFNTAFIHGSKIGYLKVVEKVLDFFQFFSRSSPHLTIPSSILAEVWDHMLLRSVTEKERDMISQWFLRMVVAREDKASGMTVSPIEEGPEPLELILHRFTPELAKHPHLSCPPCFRTMLRFWLALNATTSHVIDIPPKGYHLLLSEKEEEWTWSGLDQFWSFLLLSPSKDVSDAAAKFLSALASHITSKKVKNVMRRSILSQSMNRIQQECEAKDINWQVLSRLFVVIEMVLKESTVDKQGSFRSHNSRMKGKEIEVKVNFNLPSIHMEKHFSEDPKKKSAMIKLYEGVPVNEAIGMIAVSLFVPPSAIKLFAKGKEFSGEKSVAEWGLKHGEALMMTIRPNMSSLIEDAARSDETSDEVNDSSTEKEQEEQEEQEEQDVHPALFLSTHENGSFLDLFFFLMEAPATSSAAKNQEDAMKTCKKTIWEILQRLPTSSSHLAFWSEITEDSTKDSFAQFALWGKVETEDQQHETEAGKLLNITRLCYTLQVLSYFMESSLKKATQVKVVSSEEQEQEQKEEQNDIDATWTSKFISHGGFDMLFFTLDTLNQHQSTEEGNQHESFFHHPLVLQTLDLVAEMLIILLLQASSSELVCTLQKHFPDDVHELKKRIGPFFSTEGQMFEGKDDLSFSSIASSILSLWKGLSVFSVRFESTTITNILSHFSLILSIMSSFSSLEASGLFELDESQWQAIGSFLGHPKATKHFTVTSLSCMIAAFDTQLEIQPSSSSSILSSLRTSLGCILPFSTEDNASLSVATSLAVLPLSLHLSHALVQKSSLALSGEKVSATLTNMYDLLTEAVSRILNDFLQEALEGIVPYDKAFDMFNDVLDLRLLSLVSHTLRSPSKEKKEAVERFLLSLSIFSILGNLIGFHKQLDEVHEATILSNLASLNLKTLFTPLLRLALCTIGKVETKMTALFIGDKRVEEYAASLYVFLLSILSFSDTLHEGVDEGEESSFDGFISCIETIIIKEGIGRMTSILSSEKDLFDSWSGTTINPHYSLFSSNKQSVGMRNYGATCYLNSLVQQLYHIPQFSETLLSYECPVKEQEGEEAKKEEQEQEQEQEGKVHFFSELQQIFGKLTWGLKSSVETLGWCQQLKGGASCPGPILNVRVQEDAHEFFQSLCQQIEDQALIETIPEEPEKNISSELISSSTFKGTTVSQILHPDYTTEALTYSHVDKENDEIVNPASYLIRNREDSFTNISVQVQEMTGLEQSLAHMVEGSIINGFEWTLDDNNDDDEQQTKGEEKKKSLPIPSTLSNLDVRRRTLFKEVGDVAVFHLERFVFNFVTFNREKCNARFEFPTKLDLYPYSQQYAEMMDRGEDPLSIDRSEREQWLFELSGVVLHSGVADGGHYTSLVKKDEGKESWVYLDDSTTTPFDESKIGEACFGGESSSSSSSSSSFISSFVGKNAYLLFYRRIHPLFSTKKEEEEESTTCSNQLESLRRKIEEENGQWFSLASLFSTSQMMFMIEFILHALSQPSSSLKTDASYLISLAFILLSQAPSSDPYLMFMERLGNLLHANVGTSSLSYLEDAIINVLLDKRNDQVCLKKANEFFEDTMLDAIDDTKETEVPSNVDYEHGEIDHSFLMSLLLSTRQTVREGMVTLLVSCFQTSLSSHLPVIRSLNWEIHRESYTEVSEATGTSTDIIREVKHVAEWETQPPMIRLLDMLTCPSFIEKMFIRHTYALQCQQVLLSLAAGGDWSFPIRSVLVNRELIVWSAEALLGESSPANGKLYAKNSRFRLPSLAAASGTASKPPNFALMLLLLAVLTRSTVLPSHLENISDDPMHPATLLGVPKEEDAFILDLVSNSCLLASSFFNSFFTLALSKASPLSSQTLVTSLLSKSVPPFDLGSIQPYTIETHAIEGKEEQEEQEEQEEYERKQEEQDGAIISQAVLNNKENMSIMYFSALHLLLPHLYHEWNKMSGDICQMITSNFSMAHMHARGLGEEVMSDTMLRWSKLAFAFLNHKDSLTSYRLWKFITADDNVFVTIGSLQEQDPYFCNLTLASVLNMIVYQLSNYRESYTPKRGEQHVTLTLRGALPVLIKFAWRWRERCEGLGEREKHRFLLVWEGPGKVGRFFNHHQLAESVWDSLVKLCGRDLESMIPPDTFDTSYPEFSSWGVDQDAAVYDYSGSGYVEYWDADFDYSLD